MAKASWLAGPGATVQVKAADPVAPWVSEAETATWKVPAPVTIPAMVPVEGSIDSPGGSPVAV